MESFKAVREVIQDATERFGALAKLDEERLNILENYCGFFDKIISKFECTDYSVEVDEIDWSVNIELGVDSVTTDSDQIESYILYELIKRTISVRFIREGADRIVIRFKFPSVWYS